MTRFYISKDGQQTGPFTEEEVKGLLQSGSIGRNDLFRSEGAQSWLPLSDFGGTAPSPVSSPAPSPAPAGPQAAEPKKSNGCLMAVVIIVALLILLIGGCVFLRGIFHSKAKPVAEQSGPTTPTPDSKPAAPPPIVVGPTPKPPSYEEWFISSAMRAEPGSSPAHDDAARAYLRDERRRAISNSLPGIRTLTAWIGLLQKADPTINGKLAIVIALPDSNVVVQTWGDAVSDAGAGTLIEKDSGLYSRLRGIPLGSPVSFDFEFLEDKDDWVKEGSKTLLEGMTKPKFIVRFKDVKILGK